MEYWLAGFVLTLLLVVTLYSYRRYRTEARVGVTRKTSSRRLRSDGYLYFYTMVIIPLPLLDNLTLPFIKIGRAKTAHQRLKAQRTPLPFGMKVRAVVWVKNDVKAERYTHARYKGLRLHSDLKNEWFWFTPRLWLFMASVRDSKLTSETKKLVEW